MALTHRPYGLWHSPLQPDDMAAARRLRDVAWDDDGSTLVWLEGRGPDGVLVAQRGMEAPRDLNAERPARARVGYGGGDFTVARGQVVFADQASGRLCMQALAGGRSGALTPPFGAAAAPAVSPNGRWILFVHNMEDVDALGVVDFAGSQWPRKMVSGADFYMQPAWHPRSKAVAWIEWDHPRMPWDGTRLMLADLGVTGQGLPNVRSYRQIAGGDQVAAFQPVFSPDGTYLAYAADSEGWSHLYLYDLHSDSSRRLTVDQHDVAVPAWAQGMRSFTFTRRGDSLVFTRAEDGARRAYFCAAADGRIEPVSALASYSCVEQLSASPRRDALACVASAPNVPARVVTVERDRVHVRARSESEHVCTEALSNPEALTWNAPEGSTVHGLYYPPASSRFTAAGPPPLMVIIHGGPTSQADLGYDARSQFFATRGFAVLQVNHRGSTGYGRAYRQMLQGNWGVYDVEDAVSGARHLVDSHRAAADRMAIMGGSAGGYTVLRALTQYPGFFRAGICLYGIANLFELATDTHKFESRYLDGLLGPLPDAAPTYRERSPLFTAERLQDPVAIFQGSDDKVVPPEQSRQIVRSLQARKVAHEYHEFDGEGHGWRRPETVAAFYRKVMRFLNRHLLFS